MKKVYDDRIEWRFDGKLHRLNGPAVECSDGTKYWYQNDYLHRLDGPAIEHSNGDKYWYQNGKLHRLDGPAIATADGIKSWYINGERYSEQEWFETLPEDKKIAYLFKLSEK